MAAPKLNERDRRGTKVRTLTADLTNIAQITPDTPGKAYLVSIDVVGVRLLTAAAAQPAAFGYSRRGLFVTNASSVVSQIGTTDTIGTDFETDAGANVTMTTDGTNINVVVTASYPTDWSVNATVVMVDQFQVG